MRLAKDMILLQSFLSHTLRLRMLDEGDTFRFGDDVYKVYNVPGHSDGACNVFWEKAINGF